MLPSLAGLSLNAIGVQKRLLDDDEVDQVQPKKQKRPLGVSEAEWKAYLASKRAARPGDKVRRPRFAYTDLTPDDFQKFRERNPLHTKDGQHDRLVPYTEPPSMNELLDNKDALWLLNVRPPWATALVYGVKDVENRSRGFGCERWTLIVASDKQSAKYAKEQEADLFERLTNSGQSHWQNQLPTQYYQKIVGLVKLRALDFNEFVYEKGHCSVWYNGGADFALRVEAAFPFPTPIEYKEGAQSMIRFRKSPIFTEDLLRQVVNQLILIGVRPLPDTEPPTAGPPAAGPPADGPPAEPPGLSNPLPELPAIKVFQTKVPETTSISSLDEWGCMAWSIDYSPETITSFIENLNIGAQTWMTNNLNRALAEPPPPPSPPPGYEIWHNTADTIRQTIRDYFDLSTRDGAIRLFDAKLRKKSIPAPVREYFNERLEYAKQGLNVTARGVSHLGWTKAGFGIWTRIWTSLGIKMLLTVKEMLMGEGFKTQISGVPHIIYKPSSGESLPAHHDQMPTNALIEALHEHVRSNDSSVKAWAKKHGIQLLAHIRGGYDDGFTYTVGPLDCKKLLFCMILIVRNPPAPDIERAAWSASNTRHNFITAAAGPYFVDWFKLVQLDGKGPLNRHLRDNGFDPVSILPIRPQKNNGSPYLAMWPVGFPHGSMTNQVPRVTLTMNLTLKKVNIEKRVVKRLKNLATLAQPGSEQAAVDAAEKAFEEDTTPYHDGPTHRLPQMMADLQRNAEYAVGNKQPGPFASIAPTMEDVERFCKAIERDVPRE